MRRLNPYSALVDMYSQPNNQLEDLRVSPRSCRLTSGTSIHVPSERELTYAVSAAMAAELVHKLRWAGREIEFGISVGDGKMLAVNGLNDGDLFAAVVNYAAYDGRRQDLENEFHVG
jgi:hypothetical protein